MKSIPSTKKIDTNNLAAFLKKHNVNVDLDDLVKNAMEKYPKAYLLNSEEDDQEIELGDQATPFERALVEAKKMKLNIEEIQKSGSVGSSSTSTSSSTSRVNKKKKKTIRGRKVRNTKSADDNGNGANQEVTENKMPTSSLASSSRIKSVAPSRNVNPANDTTENVNEDYKPAEHKPTGGKYRPGTAPLHWNSIPTDSFKEDTKELEEEDRGQGEHVDKKAKVKTSLSPAKPEKKENTQPDKSQGKISKFLPLSRFF